MKPPVKPARSVSETPGTGLRQRAEAEVRALEIRPESQPMMFELAGRAEAQVRGWRKLLKPRPGSARSAADIQRLIHELEVHQVELEMQNAELREARDQMERLLEKYTELYEFAPAGYFNLTADGTITLSNLPGARLVGIERARLLGRSFAQLVSPEHRARFREFLKSVFAEQTQASVDFELTIEDEAPRIVRIQAQRTPSLQECSIVVVDITSITQAEEKLRASEVRYRRLFEAAHTGVLILDPVTHKITDANPYMTTLLGYPRAQLVGKELYEIGLLKDESASREMFRNLKLKHEVRYEDLPLQSKKGHQQEVEVVANLYLENAHSVIQCSIRDITERKKAEAALRMSRELLENVINSTPSYIYATDREHRYTLLNDAYARLIGRPVSKILGRTQHDFYPPEVANRLVRTHDEIMATGKPWQSDERINDAVMMTSKFPLRDAQGAVSGVCSVATDITERKRAEEAQKRLAVLAASNRKLEKEIVRRQASETSLKRTQLDLNRLLEESQHMQERLRQLSRQVLRAQEEERKRISRELHDVIAQTLTGINVRLAALAKEAGFEGFDHNITRTQQLVVKSVATVHAFARNLRPPVLDDLGLIPALHTFLTQFKQETGIQVSLSAFGGIEHVSGEKRTVLYRVAQEALTNIARHANANRVKVEFEEIDHAVHMKISDNGRGFHAERVMNGRMIKQLGLLGMRERLEMVGGSFSITASPRRGTTVLAQIPLTPDTAR